MSFEQEADRRLDHLNDFKQIGILEFIARDSSQVPLWLTGRRLAGLKTAVRLTKLRVLDNTLRVYGATDEGELMIFPHFKYRTIRHPLDAAAQRERDRRIVMDLSSKDENNSDRSRFGSVVADKSLDEWPVYPASGIHGWRGKNRPILIPELLSVGLEAEANKAGMSILDVAMAMRTGYATNIAILGGRTWDPSKLVQAVTMPDDQQPSDWQLFRAITGKDFRAQTDGQPIVTSTPYEAGFEQVLGMGMGDQATSP